MAQVKIRYFVAKRLRGGETAYYWQPKAELKAEGWRPERLPRSLPAAVARAEQLNAELDAWRAGDRQPREKQAYVRPDSLAALIRLYKSSPRYKRLSPTTRRDYDYHLRRLEAWGGDKAARAITPPVVQKLYEALLPESHSAANGRIRILRLLLTHGVRMGLVPSNAASKPGLIGVEGRLRIYSADEEAALIAAAEALERPSIGDGVMMGCDLGQRRGDLVRLKVMQIQDDKVRLRQSKRGARVSVPLTPRLVERLAEAAARRRALNPECPTILINEETKRPYSEGDFSRAFAEVRALAVAGDAARGLAPCRSLADALFLDTRDTAVTRLAEAGCTIPEIAAITGHSLRSIYEILKHYLELTGPMAAAAIAKLVAHRATSEEQKQAKVGMDQTGELE